MGRVAFKKIESAGRVCYGDRAAAFRSSGTYGAYYGGELVATLRNEGPGGFMDLAEWRASEPETFRPLTGAHRTLKELKAEVTRRLEKYGAVEIPPEAVVRR